MQKTSSIQRTFQAGAGLIILAGLGLLALLLGSPSGSQVLAQAAASQTPTSPARALVARIYYTSQAQLEALTSELDVWEVQPESGYLAALLEPAQYSELQAQGYRIAPDPAQNANLEQALLQRAAALPAGQDAGIAGYACYRTVEETYASLSALAAAYPDLATWSDIGDSWEKVNSAGAAGYDLYALTITNRKIAGPKPVFSLMAEIHAREYATAELAARFAEGLLASYGHDPEITWLVDHYQAEIIAMANPDGRKLAEAGYYQRKNTNDSSGGACSNPPTTNDHYGVDLNRNSSFKWGSAGASSLVCSETYRGPAAASEPETQALQSYLGELYADQRGAEISAAAPLTTTGLFITLHSYSNLVLWPWSWTYSPAPNEAQLAALGSKLAYFNGYTPEAASDLYPTSGSTDDWLYGELGVAAYTFELGDFFFESCDVFEDTIYPDNLNALLYAFKAARRPYQAAFGPDTLALSLLPSEAIAPGQTLTVTARADSLRTAKTSQAAGPVAAARLAFGEPSWDAPDQTLALQAADGLFNSQAEALQTQASLPCLPSGPQWVFAESQDQDGDWGVPAIASLEVGEAYGPAQIAPASAQNSDPGVTITYTLAVTNSGNLTDTFTVTGAGAWLALAPAALGPLPPCGSASLVVAVSPPATATIGAQEAVSLTLASQADPALAATSVLTTSLWRNDLQAALVGEAPYWEAGASVTYTLQVTNTGNISDSFTAELSTAWQATWDQNPLALGPGQSSLITLQVQIPPDYEAQAVTSVLVTIQSAGDPQRQVSLELPMAAPYRAYLPYTAVQGAAR